ncbi:MAG: hypothetical protein ACXVJ7_11465 [Acidimicrobiia bacterium]
MATALQCPECGFKHRLDTVGDQDVFPCARCSRQLKVPVAYRPAVAERRAGNGSRPTNGTAAAVGSARGAAAARRGVGGSAASMRLPVRILLWVLAFILGAVVVRLLAKWTGLVGGNTFVDLLIDHSFTTYARLFVLVPVWALFATLFATAFIEGPGWYRRRRAGIPVAATRPSPDGAGGAGRTARRPAATADAGAATGAAAGGVAAAKRSSRPQAIPRRPVAAGAAATAAGSSRRSAERTSTLTRSDATAPVSAAADATSALEVVDYAAQAAAGHRPRRIPRRDTGS